MHRTSPFINAVLACLALAAFSTPSRAADLPKDPDKLAPAQAVDAWLAVVEDEAQPSVRRNYAEGRIVMLGKAAVPRLMEVWETVSGDRRGRVAEIFGMMTDLPDSAVEALLAELRSRGPGAHPHVARALADRKVTRAVPLMVAAWPEAPDEMRLAILHALGRIGDETASDIFMQSLDSRDRLIRATAADGLLRVLATLRNRGENPLNSPKGTVPRASKDAYRPIFKRTLDYSEKGSAFESRRMLVAGLGQVGDPGASGLLRRLLRGQCVAVSIKPDQVLDMRIAAAGSLGRLQCHEAVDDLTEAARAGDAMLRRAALDALVSIDDEACVPALVDLLEECAPKDRRDVVRALRQIAGQPFGDTPAPWRQWWDERETREEPPT